MKRMLIVSLILMALSACAGYVPGRQAYWDAQVREMCEKDGGVTIYEQIVVTTAQAEKLPKVAGLFGVAPESLAKPYEPAFIRIHLTLIREGNPSVVREQQDIIRRSDGQVIGRAISYGRGGGDIPSPAHPSGFSCPDYLGIYKGIHQVYRIEETKK